MMKVMKSDDIDTLIDRLRAETCVVQGSTADLLNEAAQALWDLGVERIMAGL